MKSPQQWFSSLYLTTFLVLGTTFLMSCNNDSGTNASGPRATFKIQLDNAATVLLNDIQPFTATSLRAKLGGVDLLNQCTNGNPPGTCIAEGIEPDPDIWINTGCNGDLAQCNESNTQFFELINPAAANTELNSQSRSIAVGTFTHVRVYLLNNDSGNNIECDSTLKPSVRPNVPLQIALPSPITVAEGETVTVTLSYDPSSLDCATDSTISTVFQNMTATATVVQP